MAKDRITIKVSGVQEAIAKLKNYQVIKKEACSNILKTVGLKIEADAKRKSPVDTSRLKSSISTNWSGSGLPEGKTGGQAKSGDGVGQPGGPKGLAVVVGTNVKYAPYQEFGTRKMSAKPYLFPAYHKNEGEVAREISKVFKK